MPTMRRLPLAAFLLVSALLCAEPLPANSPASLEAAIEDMAARGFLPQDQAEDYLARLAKSVNRSGESFIALQRAALTANRLVSGQPVLFVERAQYVYEHHNTETIYQTGEICTGKYRPGGPLKAIDLATGEVTVICDPGPTGHLRDPEVRPDGRRVVFSMRRHVGEDYHLYEIRPDGSDLRQLTSAPGVFDIDPIYLPGGGIVFTSSREPKYCGCNRHIMGNLFRMESDGANIHQVGKSTLFEGHSAITPDGRVLYDRWEYVDRNFGDAQGLWTMNPDGTNHAVFWGNNTASPGAVLDARIIPGSGHCICIFSSCHDNPWGALAIIDRKVGVDGREPVVRTWPADAIDLVGKGNYDMFTRVKPKYEDPWPLSDTTFLVTRQITPGKALTGIFLVDTFGNEILLHAEGRGCYSPMPLGPQSAAPVRPLARNYESGNGTFYVVDVSIGTHMEDVSRDEIRYLRVVEAPEKRGWTRSGWGGQGQQAPAMNWHSFENKRILGTVPVEPDGSVYFECPSDRFVYFQLLDANGMMIQSMRSGTIIQSGEQQGCTGCHEDRNESIPLQQGATPLALKRRPSALDGWNGPQRTFSYQDEVQPILDRHCVSCHDYGKPAGEGLNLARDRTLVFNTSYTELWSLGFLECVGGGPAETRPARSWGSHRSKLITVLREGHPDHKDVQLSDEELGRLITWVDLNAPYYPITESAWPDGFAGRAPLTPGEVKTLGKLTGAKFVTGHGRGQRAQVSFERPELSRCLSKLDKESLEYQQALDMIKEGTKRLRKTPRCDMKGFQPSEIDQQRLEKYIRRQAIESTNRRAIREGRKIYDRDHQSS
jgi:hypothetical protein